MAKIMTTLSFLTTCLFVLRYHQCVRVPNTSAAFDDPKELLFRELSMDTYFNLPFHEQEDTAASMRRQYLDRGHFNERDWLSKTDYEYQKQRDQPALKLGPGGAVVDTDFYNIKQNTKTRDTMNPDTFTIFHLCYAISYIWRRGRKGLHRYLARRQTYYDHLPFEIGYITQTIMAKYQNVLELYEYATRMEKGNRMGRPHLYFFYKNILEDCRAIIHLCNMIHEVTRKYRVLQYSAYNESWITVVYDPAQKFQEAAGNVYRDPFPSLDEQRPLRELERGVEGFEHQKHFHEDPKVFAKIKAVGQLEEAEKKQRDHILKKQRNYFIDHCSWASTSSTSRRTRRWRSNQPLEYGWDTDAQGD